MSRSTRAVLAVVLLVCAADTNRGDALADDGALLDVADLRIRDPFVFTDVPNARTSWSRAMSNRQAPNERLGVLHQQGPAALADPGHLVTAARRILGRSRLLGAGDSRLPWQVLPVRDPQCGACQTRHAGIRRRRSPGAFPRSHRRRCHAA